MPQTNGTGYDAFTIGVLVMALKAAIWGPLLCILVGLS